MISIAIRTGNEREQEKKELSLPRKVGGERKGMESVVRVLLFLQFFSSYSFPNLEKGSFSLFLSIFWSVCPFFEGVS